MRTRETDPVMAEVRAVRDGIAARADYDVAAIFQRIREMEDGSGREYVEYPPRRLVEGSGEQLAV
ncbi:MAG: hypothetical protein OXU77_21110 [Gammaproteobacteria bacterium]|nr:hypothetical protein [Gammaproteobacteria bacterium]MDE0040031.1 hypothetical protein [Gammaproteobacteria bacterium]MDE0444928.1 hypothetical protein [Gammaproteobacteria bacterium]